jgi:hypothetical protein
VLDQQIRLIISKVGFLGLMITKKPTLFFPWIEGAMRRQGSAHLFPLFYHQKGGDRTGAPHRKKDRGNPWRGGKA